MLMRTDPFRDLDRLTQQLLGTNARPSAMLMDAWRDGDRFVVEFDLPGVNPDSVDLDVERNVLTVTAQRPPVDEKAEFLAAERPRGVFSRQLVLGDNLDLDRIEAAYRDGVLRLHIPVAEKAKPRKITINPPARPGPIRPSPPGTGTPGRAVTRSTPRAGRADLLIPLGCPHRPIEGTRGRGAMSPGGRPAVGVQEKGAS